MIVSYVPICITDIPNITATHANWWKDQILSPNEHDVDAPTEDPSSLEQGDTFNKSIAFPEQDKHIYLWRYLKISKITQIVYGHFIF